MVDSSILHLTISDHVIYAKGVPVFFNLLHFAAQVESDPHKELIQPAMHGTQNVLSSVAKSKDTVKRVVLTSSVAGTPSIACLYHLCNNDFDRSFVCTPQLGWNLLLCPPFLCSEMLFKHVQVVCLIWCSSPGIGKVILRCLTAIIGNEDSGPLKPPKNGDVYTEEDWNTTSTPEKGAYFVSKVRLSLSDLAFFKSNESRDSL